MLSSAAAATHCSTTAARATHVLMPERVNLRRLHLFVSHFVPPRSAPREPAGESHLGEQPPPGASRSGHHPGRGLPWALRTRRLCSSLPRSERERGEAARRPASKAGSSACSPQLPTSSGGKTGRGGAGCEQHAPPRARHGQTCNSPPAQAALAGLESPHRARSQSRAHTSTTLKKINTEKKYRKIHLLYEEHAEVALAPKRAALLPPAPSQPRHCAAPKALAAQRRPP